MPCNSKGDKYIEFKIKDIIYSDSTERDCNLKFNIIVKSIGQKAKIGLYENYFGSQDYFFGYVVDGTKRFGRFCSNAEVKKNDSIIVPCQLKLYHNDKSSIYYTNRKLFNIPVYDGNVKAESLRIERARIEAEAKRRQDSIKVYYMPPATQLMSNYTLEVPKGYRLPDTLQISKDKYGLRGQKIMRIINFYGRRDTIYQHGFTESEIRDYESAIRAAYLRSKPIEKINDREVFSYFAIGDTIQDFLKRTGNKKIHIVDDNCYQLTFPHELTKEPQIIEFNFYDGKLSNIKRITPINSLPTNNVRTAFQLLKFKDDLDKIEKAVNSQSKKRRN